MAITPDAPLLALIGPSTTFPPTTINHAACRLRGITPREVWRFCGYVLPLGGHWLWQGAKLPSEYAVFGHKGRNAYAHRLAWEWWGAGPIPDGHCLMKPADGRCDVRYCINPACWELVTIKEQQRRRGYNTRGVRKRKTWLPPEIVRWLREQHAEGVPRTYLQRFVDVSPMALGHYLTGVTPSGPAYRGGGTCGREGYIRTQLTRGRTCASIARELGVSRERIRQIKAGWQFLAEVQLAEAA